VGSAVGAFEVNRKAGVLDGRFVMPFFFERVEIEVGLSVKLD